MPVLPASGYATPAAPSIEALPVAPELRQDIRATPEMFGGLTADATSRFGQSLEKAAASFENIHKFYQETAAADQSLKTQVEVNKLMYGDPDKPGDRGYIGLEGEQAMREMPVRRKQIESIISGARANLGTQYAVSHFDNEIQRFRNYILTDMGRKYDQEMTKWRDQTDKGRKDLSAAEVSRAANSDDPGMVRFKESLANDEALTRKIGEGKGLPKEAIDAEVVTRRSALAKEKAEALLATDPLQAREFINLNGDILTTHHPELLARANAAVTKQMADDIVAGKDVSRYSEKLPGPMVRGGAVQTRISEEAAKNGLDPATILAFADIESSMGRNLGSRGNIFQLGGSEWAAAGGGQLGDTETDIKNGLSDIKRREADLTVALGRKPEGWELYLAHQQGVGGAISLLTNPNTPAGNLVRSPTNISGNSGDPNAPASQFVAKTRALFENRKARYSGGSSPEQPATTAGTDQPPTAATPGATSGGPTAAPEVNVGSPRLQELMRSAPERDPGQPADAEVPGLVAALERDAQKIPPNAPPGVWQAVVQKERRIFNAAYTDQQHALAARKRDDEENDHQVMQEYRLRLGTDKPPTVAEVTADKRWRSEKNAQEMIGFIGRALKPDPPAHVAKAVTSDLYRRMDDKESDRLVNMDPINQAFINQQITEKDLSFLEQRWKEKTGTKEADVKAKTDRIWKSMVLRQLRPHAAMGPTFEQFQDIQAQDQGQMTSGEREMGWREKVDETVKDYKTEGKNTAELFDPKPGNSKYIGSPEFMAEFMPEQTLPTATKAGSGPDVRSLDAVKRTFKLDNPVEVERAKAAVVHAFQSGLYGPRTSPEAKVKAGAILEGLGFRHAPVQPPVPVAR